MNDLENNIIKTFFISQEGRDLDINPFASENGNNMYSGKVSFQFEDDFIEDNVRCIPMIVRFKMDIAGIKLKLAEWSKFSFSERLQLTELSCISNEEVTGYRNYLKQLINMHTGNEAVHLMLENYPAWANTTIVPLLLQNKASEYQWTISIKQWKSLTNLQRFALLKLFRPGHENKNFPKAMREFGWV